MNAPDSDRLPPDLDDVARLLRAERSEATAVELDRIKLRARAQAQASRRSTLLSFEKGTLVTSRLLITVLLAFGIVASGTGVTLAIAPTVAGGQSASTAQYDEGTPPPSNEVKAGQESGTNPGKKSSAPSDRIGVAPATASNRNGDDPTSDTAGEPTSASSAKPAVGNGSGPRTVQASRQEASSGEDTLPFTGFAAMPILLIGVAMLAAGLFLRRRAAGA